MRTVVHLHAPPVPAPPHPLGPRLVQDVRSRWANLEKAWRRVRAAADDEAVHDLRVASRRLGAAFDVWRDALPGRERRTILRRLRRLRRRAGRVRDLEIHAQRLRSLAETLPIGPREVASGFALELAAKRERRLRRLTRRLGRRRVRRLESGVAHVLGAARLTQEAVEASRSRRAELAAEATRAAREALVTGDDRAFHAARIAVKKWRYALESLDAVLGEVDAAALERSRTWQRTLGDLQDWASLGARIERRAGVWEPSPAAASWRELREATSAERDRCVERFTGAAR